MLYPPRASAYLRGALAFFLALACSAQSFDVVSVKYSGSASTTCYGPCKTAVVQQESFRYSGQRLTCELPLRAIVREAFGVKDLQIEADDWLRTEVYRVDAVMPEGAGKEGARPMLRKMLEERFGMRSHSVRKDVPVYALVEAKGGFRLHAIGDPNHPTRKLMETPNGMVQASSVQGPGRYTAASTSIGDFADWLRLQVDRPVVNLTAIQGAYEVDLRWTPGDGELQRTIERQMGLTLDARKMPFEVVVIDRMAKTPTAN